MGRLLTASAFACLLMPGCGGFSPKPDPSRFFALAPLSEAESPGNHGRTETLSLGVGPVKFPAYLDRGELVTRVTRNRFAVSEHDRWIQPLEENFIAVLSQNLSALLGNGAIVQYPWQNSRRPTYQIEIEVLRFEARASEDVELSARWAIIDTATKRPLSVRDSRLTRRAAANASEASVAALSDALGAFSREVADIVRGLAPQQKP